MDVHAHPIYRAVRAGFIEVRQVALLMAVVREPGLSVRDYAARLHLSRTVIARATNALVEMNLLTDEKPHADLRLRLLRPTDRGRTVITEIAGEEALDATAEPNSQAAVH